MTPAEAARAALLDAAERARHDTALSDYTPLWLEELADELYPA